jgi:hypothetical protein
MGQKELLDDVADDEMSEDKDVHNWAILAAYKIICVYDSHPFQISV